ncbi:hypothetical protein V490_05979 [Pseudogymnoascus sp. VKM F-3557]|nr:hypothetical protein V490_05979 [Pseudogymnoascus sp. VKM F-3557]
MRKKTSGQAAFPASPDLKRCWNCRGLKIACDKTIPFCHNCRDKGRKCLGYGTRLSWPRQGDSRRFAHPKGIYTIPTRSQPRHFINTSFGDIEAFESKGLDRYDPATLNRIWFSQQPPNIARLDTFLAVYGYSSTSPLAASSHDSNDLCSLLVKLSLKDDSFPSLASRCAISALSYYYLGMEMAAAVSKTNALRALQASIEAPELSQAMQMMAASMLLCMFETLDINTPDLSWTIFFCGTKRIANLVTEKDDTYFGEKALLMDWIFYHDVMYKFSIRHWDNKNSDQIELAGQRKLISKAVFAPERLSVVPILGCSLELMDLICQVIDVVLDHDNVGYQSESQIAIIKSLEIRLQNLEQRHSGISDTDSGEAAHQVRVAELFRLAALIYLLRLAKGESVGHKAYNLAVASAFDVMGQCAFCERPWPMFIIGLEARTDRQRSVILTVFKASLQRQPHGTMSLADRMVRDAWAQQDLSGDEIDQLVLYSRVINRNHVPPCFT